MPPPRPGSGRATPIVRFAQCRCNYEAEKQVLRLKMRCCVFFFIAFFLRRKAQFGMQHPMLPRAWGEQPHKAKTPYESILASFSKRNRLCFIKQFPSSFMPEGQNLGLNALRLRGGMGATQAPIYDDLLRMCVSLARSAQWEWPCHCQGVGAASAPT